MQQYIHLNETKNGNLIFDTPGEYVVYFHNYSGKITCRITAPEVSVELIGLYEGNATNAFHVETIQHHCAPNSSSNLLIKGVFEDASTFHYHGLIRIEKEAQKSRAYQKNQNLVLSPKVFVESKPDLEILANDVFCTHGSSTGRLNESQVRYIESRGIPETEAKNLMIEGFKEEILEKVRKYHRHSGPFRHSGLPGIVVKKE
ncbi:SufD family Fe-S cluster assembly protein [Candidatus Roizmanbacteria bacterium]|nr:SufD family Fe-S cluster assembly protein [Candidatus Roizmanbacteria bacterium]